MSGNFTQQGNIAIFNKYKRAKNAIVNGADLVIEFPAIYSTSSAEYFSYSAINILDKLGIVTDIAFGSENTNINELKYISNTIIKNETAIYEKIRSNLKTGISFASARYWALEELLIDDKYVNIISKPNNILAIEYIKALKKLKSKIKPYTINRIDQISATNIRKKIQNNDYKGIEKIVPIVTYDEIKKDEAIFNDRLFEILKYKIITTNVEALKNINEVTEGLENKILRSAYLSNNYEEFIKNIKSKRYVESKIKRISINILLDIDKDLFKNSINNNISYANVLAISKKSKTLLSELSKKSKIPILISLSDEKISKLDKDVQILLRKDILAENIYSIISKSNSNRDFKKFIEI